jgi:hypothetical protein
MAIDFRLTASQCELRSGKFAKEVLSPGRLRVIQAEDVAQ